MYERSWCQVNSKLFSFDHLINKVNSVNKVYLKELVGLIVMLISSKSCLSIWLGHILAMHDGNFVPPTEIQGVVPFKVMGLFVRKFLEDP